MNYFKFSESEEDDEEGPTTPPPRSPSPEIPRAQIVRRTWHSTARRAKNQFTFEQMVRQNSQSLYRTLVKELILGKQKKRLTDIPGFSYFLLIKYTLDPDDITDIMGDI